MCGVIGISGHSSGFKLLTWALHMLKHRGQDAAGVAGRRIMNGGNKVLRVDKNFGGADKNILENMERSSWDPYLLIGHTRYTTQGENNEFNMQPQLTQSNFGNLALADNGHVVNLQQQRKFLSEKHPRKMNTDNEAELLGLSIESHRNTRKPGRDIVESIFQTMDHVLGAFSVVMITEFDDCLYAFCDPRGIRPLVFAQINEKGKSYFVVTSETHIIDNFAKRNDAFIVKQRWLEPGEFIIIKGKKVESYLYHQSSPKRQKYNRRFCLLEYFYFSHPNSRDYRGEDFYSLRKKLGRQLAIQDLKNNPELLKKVDMVVPVPRSGKPAALGYSHESGIPYEMAVTTDEIRSFIDQNSRKRSEFKYQVNPNVVRGKSIILVDDSIIRGNAMNKIIRDLFFHGAREVHVRIASPMFKDICNLGINIPTKEELIAYVADEKIEDIRVNLGKRPPDTLDYLPLSRATKALGVSKDNLCAHCFSGEHPIV